MKRIFRAILFSVLVLIGSPVLASDYGRWLCSDCNIARDADAVGSRLDTEAMVIGFLKATINKSVPIWQPGDTVTICDGAKCANVKYVGSNLYIYSSLPYADSRSGYRNVAAGANTSALPAGMISNLDVAISWKLVDVYILDHGTGNESYLGSYYEITGFSVSGNPVIPIKTIPQ